MRARDLKDFADELVEKKHLNAVAIRRGVGAEMLGKAILSMLSWMDGEQTVYPSYEFPADWETGTFEFSKVDVEEEGEE